MQLFPIVRGTPFTGREIGYPMKTIEAAIGDPPRRADALDPEIAAFIRTIGERWSKQ